MKLLSWNVRGLGTGSSKASVYAEVTESPSGLLFMETKICRGRIKRIRHRCEYVNGIEVESVGTKEGLCLAWKQGVNVTLCQFSRRHIDVVIDDDEVKGKWRFTGFYGSPYERDRNNSWEELRTLYTGESFPWFVCGDFNEIMYGSEKKGGVPRNERRMEVFREVLVDCGLMDMGFSGRWFTWERGNLPVTNIRERLDRGVANEEWQNMFPDGSIGHLTHSMSDHCLLLLKTKREETGAKVSSFKFETCWAGKIQGDRKGRKALLNNRLSEILAEDRDEQNMAELVDTKVQLNLEIDKDERYWEQRARINWLKFGDRNTVFFHSQVSSRRRRNMIQKLQSNNGQVAENIPDIKNIARNYFQNLFETEGRECCNYLLSGIKRCITEEDNQILMAHYKKEEIQEVAFEMGPTKAPGEDGFSAIFYQQCLHIVQYEVSSFCLQILNGDRDFKQVNSTNIVLIPKVANPTSMKQFRPISLCNVIYKIMAKAIANRLRGVIEKCIDAAQSAFVPGRLITDNILLAYEILHTLKQKRMGRKGFMAVKLDMSKAYDRVEWNFVKEIMTMMGFANRWIGTIMKCITSISYSMVINGYKGKKFWPSRGLRQGDPLSPFLFLMCGEGLSSLLRLAMNEGNLKGVKASRSGPKISHLLFADDCILFSEASRRGANVLKEILRKYRHSSGQCVNFDKSTVFFSRNTPESERNLVINILGVRSSNNPERYLGLPNMVGRRKKESFQLLKDKMKQCIDHWSMRHLSQGERKFLLSQFCKQFPLIRWHVFFCRKHYALRLRASWLNFGGKRELGGRVFTGVNRGNYAN
ncbi:reverse transcriptase [Gossypium australe]|uniref:Reverse transcriptase n=1 Tax=Gossypium australe TaxID=47621 RepID=A0A5B6W446_9ROSI|nr:reverse transcriptase [Gossypium australe]